MHQFDENTRQFRLGRIGIGLWSLSASIVELFISQFHEHVLTMESQKAKSMTHTRDGTEYSLIHHYIFSVVSNQDSSRLFFR